MKSSTANPETRGLAAALSGPAFLPRATTKSLAGAERHMARWVPESSAVLPRSLRAVAFADRLVAPLFTAASQMGGVRMFSNYQSDGFRERQVAAGGWLFPKPWYQDELRWLAASRMQPPTADAMFTTRGTFASRDAGPGRFEQSVPPELFPYVAPSLAGGSESYSPSAIDAWSPSASTTSMSAARMYASVGASLSSALSPLAGLASARSGDVANVAGRSPQMTALAASVRTAFALPSVSAMSSTQSRLATIAPEMVPPPAPRRATASINDNGSVANLEYREQLAAQRSAVQQRLMEIAAQTQSQAVSSAGPSGAAAASSSVAWDQVAQTQPVVGERQGQAKSLARQHVELLAQPTPATERANEVTRSAAVAVAAQSQNNPSDQSGQNPQLRSAETANQASAQPVQDVAPLRTLDVAKLAQLVEQLRFAELVAADTSRGAFAAVQGPQLLMPAGLGGLAASVASIANARFATTYAPAMQASSMPGIAMPGVAVPSGIEGSSPRRSASAFASVGESAPRALAHVAWSDRWLGRFAGAAPEQLTSFTSATSASPTLSTRGERAPATVFVAPRLPNPSDGRLTLDAGARAVASGVSSSSSPEVAGLPFVGAPSAMPANVVAEGTRYDDDAETPDDVFAAIASSAASSRIRQRAELNAPVSSAASTSSTFAPSFATTSASAVEPSVVPANVVNRPLTMQAPQVTGAGFAANLSASPFAGGLREAGMVSAESSAPTFDVRAMFTAALVEAFFRGEYADLATTATAQPFAGPGTSSAARSVTEFAPTWINPVASRLSAAGSHSQRATGDAESSVTGSSATATAQVATAHAAAERESSVTQIRGRSVNPAQASQVAADSEAMPGFAGTEDASPGALDSSATRIVHVAPNQAQPDSFEVYELAVPAAFGGLDYRGASDVAAASNQRVDYRPGAVGRSASAWSVSQQNTSTDLLLDFLPPELVVAAQSYGLTPQAALIAARLSAAGPAAIASLASQVDWAFLHAPSMRAELSTTGRSSVAAGSRSESWADVASSDDASIVGRAVVAGDRVSDAEAATRFTTQGDGNAALADAGAAINSLAPARQPRGAFLWPQASASALGIKADALGAAGADSQSRFSIAALEVLAAKAVADLGAYATPALAQARLSGAAPTVDGVVNPVGAAGGQAVPFVDVSRRPELLRSVLQIGSSMAAANGISSQAGVDGGADAAEPYTAAHVVDRVAAQLPAIQQQQFRALFLRGIGSPSVRAAQALALVHRSGALATNASLAERASLAWDAMPMLEVQKHLESGQGGFDLASLEALAASVADATSTVVIPNAPRLASALAALQSMVAPTINGNVSNNNAASTSASLRAGDSLASLVTSNVSSSSNASGAGAVRRAPTAAAEMVRTGTRRTGESEIPDWFEKAARKMFGEPSGTAADGFSLSDLTMINAALPQQVAASTRGESVAPSAAPSVASSGAEGGGGEKIDIERTARDVYRAVLQIMEAARARNGEPYL